MTDDVLVENGDVVESFEKIEGDMRFPLVGGAANVTKVVVDAQRPHLMAESSERRDDVVLSAPRRRYDVGAFRNRVRRDEVAMDEGQDPRLVHIAMRCRR